jgi:hypothetical protein
VVSEVEKTADGYSAAVFYKYFETAYFALPNKELVHQAKGRPLMKKQGKVE